MRCFCGYRGTLCPGIWAGWETSPINFSLWTWPKSSKPLSAAQSQIQHRDLGNFSCFQPQNTLESCPFLFLDYCWYLPGTPNRQIPYWLRKDCTMVLFSSMSQKQCWLWKLLGDFPPVFFTELTYILRGFQWYISPTAVRSFQKPGASEFGVCIQTAEKPQIPVGKAAAVWTQTGILWVKELHRHPHRQWKNTSVPWPEAVSVGNEEPARTSSPMCPRRVICLLQDCTFPLNHLTEKGIQV